MFSRIPSGPANSYIIAEVGQNHQGSIGEALRYIAVFAGLGANAVKFQMRHNKILFDSNVYNKEYNSDNSFGVTYGEHREALELPLSCYPALKQKCKDNNVDFIITPFDEPSLHTCVDLKVDAVKVASFDLGNIPFLHQVALTGIPIILSTGGGTSIHIQKSIECIQAFHSDLALLHCVSQYPCPVESVQLDKISELHTQFSGVTIGLSDHFNGIITGPLAYTLGARVFEKHVTFDRSQKGTDHPFSLEPDGFRKFCRDIDRTAKIFKIDNGYHHGQEPVFQKLGKSIVATKDINSGDIIDITHLSGRICQPGLIPVRESSRIIGTKASRNILAGQYIDWTDIES